MYTKILKSTSTVNIILTDIGQTFQEEQSAYCKVRALLDFAAGDIKSDLDEGIVPYHMPQLVDGSVF